MMVTYLVRCAGGSRSARPLAAVLAAAVAVALSVLSGTSARAQITLTQLSSDPFTNTTSQHATEVEPDTFSFGSTIVSAFQAGRFTDGGASDIAFATSTDGGATWTNGVLPGITNIQMPGNPYNRVSDTAVAFDSAHGVWMIESLPLNQPETGIAVLVSRSTDGINWDDPVTVTTGSDLDKGWIACDNSPSSAFFGNCYVEFDNPAAGDLIQMSVSSDGGLTWGTPKSTANRAAGIGGQPLVQPNGTVIVPIESASSSAIVAFTSTDGGNSWSKTVTVSSIIDHGDAGGIRSGPLPSAEIDGAGTVYVVWQDCRFRAGCTANDIVLSTSSDGVTWTAATRIPIDAVTSTFDHFIPGIGVDVNTSGSTAHLGVTYYFYPQSNCTSSTCKLNVGFIASTNGGATWSRAQHLAGPMRLNWLASTILGVMVGDYISTSYSNGKAHGVFAVASTKVGSVFNEAMFTTATGLSAPEEGPEFSSAGEEPVFGVVSDHPQRLAPIRIN